MMIQNEIIKKIVEKYESIWALIYLAWLSNWDTETYMPEVAIELRSKAHGKIDVLIQQLYLDEELEQLLTLVTQDQNLTAEEKGIVRVLKRSLNSYKKLPASYVEKRSILQNEAGAVWRKAKNTNDFASFQPYLQEIIDMCKEKSNILWYTEHPYDTHLDIYEEWLTTSEVESYFAWLKPRLLELISKVQDKYKQNTGIEKMTHDQKQLEKLNEDILTYLGFNRSRQRLDIAAHPFSSWFTNQDLRITTRYESQFQNTLFGTIHEFGHSLYDMQCSDMLQATPIAWWQSLVIHESQSRFWENCVGRSISFLNLFYDRFVWLHDDFAWFSQDDFYNYINHIEPNLIRVDADEIHYHIHILIRYEIEKWLIEWSIKVADLPIIWNQKYKEYLGVDVPTDALWVLQDVHRSFGLFGYFPTYSMGTALSAIWKDALEKDLGSIEILVTTTDGIQQIRARYTNMERHIHSNNFSKKTDLRFHMNHW